MYDKKIAIVVREDLQTWQKLNVAAFLASAIAIKFPETHGGDFVTKDNQSFLPFLKHPILIYKTETKEQLHRILNRAKERALEIGVYIDELFATRSGEENVMKMSEQTTDNMNLCGLIVYGENKKVDKAIDKLKFCD